MCLLGIHRSTRLDQRGTRSQHVYHDDGDAKLSVGDEVVWTAKHKLRLKKFSLPAGTQGTVCAVGSCSIYVRFDALRPQDVDQSAATLVRHVDVATKTIIEVGDPFTVETDVSCAKTVVGKGATGSVLAVLGDRVWMSVAQDKDKLGAGALCVERKNVCTLAGIPRRWEVAATSQAM